MSINQPLNKISVEELASRLQEKDETLQLIDVREPEEAEIASIPGFQLLPLSQFNQWSEEIPTRFQANVETLVICHHGVRSAKMCHWLQSIGFTQVKNITGGIDAYSVMVDSTIPRY